MLSARPGLRFTLCVLLAINTMNFFDRQVPGAVAEQLRKELIALGLPLSPLQVS